MLCYYCGVTYDRAMRHITCHLRRLGYVLTFKGAAFVGRNRLSRGIGLARTLHRFPRRVQTLCRIVHEEWKLEIMPRTLVRRSCFFGNPTQLQGK